ncbi:hypothetical protein [Candidatus Tisiphia endosymbiont of Neophilaenus lineatus]|uniref:hypothetical protein n=1 Tax=Candidatus Tisiphia endosymbiont of Neophilaenus lineatus TaxID=3139336 RepID=UPI0035CBDDBE
MSLIIYKLFPTFAQYLIYISLNLTVPKTAIEQRIAFASAKSIWDEATQRLLAA